MHTRSLMTLSAAFLAALGVGITFLPQELLAQVGAQPERNAVVLVQMLGALYLGFAVLDWMNRGTHMGGIFGRPVTMPNFFMFAVGALALLKAAFAQRFALEVTALAAVYAAFALWFGVVLFTEPETPAG